MLLDELSQRRVVFVGGKGGVGKTTVASGLALAAALAGKRVLLVSTDPAHNLGQLWEHALGDAPVRVFAETGGHIDGVEIDPQATVDRHLAAVESSMRHMLPERLHAQAAEHLALAREAPGSHEAAVLERVADAVELGLASYDIAIFDTAPTGHTLRLLSLPAQLGSWATSLLVNRERSDRFGSAMRGLVSTGLPGREASRVDADARLRHTLAVRRERFTRVRKVLADAETTRFVLVSIAEAIPVRETLDLAHALESIGIAPGALVVNRRSPADAGGLLAERSRREAIHVAALADELHGVPLVQLPLVSEELIGAAALRSLAATFAGPR